MTRAPCFSSSLGELAQGVLRLRHRQPVAGDDDDRAAADEQLRNLGDGAPPALRDRVELRRVEPPARPDVTFRRLWRLSGGFTERLAGQRDARAVRRG